MADPVTLALITTAASTAIGAKSSLMGGDAAESEAEFNAGQLESSANETRASSQRESLEYRRNTKLAQSNLLANAAASGGGADDEGVLRLGEDIAERGELQALTAMFKGENNARGMEDKANMLRVQGKAKKKAAKLKAIGTIIGGAGSMFGQFGNVTGGTMSPSATADPWAGMRTTTYG